MTLPTKNKQELKAKAHALRPVIALGNKGITAALLKEMNQVLTDHELIKIRLQGEDKQARKILLNEIATQVNAEVIQLIGHIGVLYRKANAS